jgi:hypothetical protein
MGSPGTQVCFEGGLDTPGARLKGDAATPFHSANVGNPT